MSGGGSTNVHRNSLLTQAKVWDEQSQVMGNITNEIAGLKMTTSGWPWADAVTTYNQVVQGMGSLSGEGQQQMVQIVDALCVAAQRYGATEEQLIQASDGVFH